MSEETKTCPYCMEQVSAEAKKCKHCGEILDVTLRELENLKKQQNSTVVVNNNNNNNNNNGGFVGGAVPAGPPKSRLVYILLAIFLGGLGIHNFYAGRTGAAVGQLLISLFLSWLIVPIFIVGLWVLIEIFVVNKDGRGVPFA